MSLSTSSTSSSPPDPFLTLLSSILTSIDSAASLSPLPYFSALITQLKPIIQQLHHHQSNNPSLLKSLQSLSSQLTRTLTLLNSSSPTPTLIQFSTHSLGRCLALLIMTWPADTAPSEIKDKMRVLHKDMMGVRFDIGIPIPIPPAAKEFDEVLPDFEDVLFRVNKGDDDEGLGVALEELGALIGKGVVGEEEETGNNVVAVLLNRLGSARNVNRLKIILLLRTLAAHGDENKESMAGIEALTIIVRSLTRDADESREAVGLLMDISGNPKVRQRIGRVQGCIVMLVTLFNGDDLCASEDAGKLLCALSSNTQNVLLMAEAGYFVPLVQYLKQGSDMNKILMATAISRMALTDQMRASLGEEGSIEPLVKMFTSGKLEGKLSSLAALRNLSSLEENIKYLINAGLVPPLLQLLFSVTSVLMTLREPASAIIASLAKSESILVHKDVALQMLSLLNLSGPAIQFHLLQALNSISSHSKAKRVRSKMRENGAVQLLLPFLIENNAEIRTIALNLLFNLSKDSAGDLSELLGESHFKILVDIISMAASENEKAAAIAILSNIPTNDKKATEILTRANLLPLLVTLLRFSITSSSTPTRMWLLESISCVLIRFTVPWDKKLQRVSAAHGVIPCLVKLLSDGSAVAKCRAATSLAQLSENSLSLCKGKSSRWLCPLQSPETFCEVHNGHCVVKNTFCLVTAEAVSPLVRVLEGKEREADEAILNALTTLMQDEIWENGIDVIEKASGVQAIIRILEVGNLKAQEKAVWMLERIFRLETHRNKYGESAQVLLIDLAQKGDPTLKPVIAKILAHLQLLQMQSSYF